MTSLARELGLVPGDLCKKSNEQNLQRYNVALDLPRRCEVRSAQVTPSIRTLPRQAVPGDCHRSDVCRTVAIASPRYRLHFRKLLQLCTLKKQRDEASHLPHLQAAGKRTSFWLAGRHVHASLLRLPVT